jgi:hypothetical protein
MKRVMIMACLLGVQAASTAQDLVVQRGANTFRAVKVDEKVWLLQLDGEEYFIIQRSTIDTLTKRIAIKDAVIARHEKVIAAQDTLLRVYAGFEQAANVHIENQKQLITVADSLYTGYKSLYSDLKDLIGLTNLALTASVGLADTPDSNWRPIGSIGLGYNRWLAQYQFGKDFKGLLVGFHWPF